MQLKNTNLVCRSTRSTWSLRVAIHLYSVLFSSNWSWAIFCIIWYRSYVGSTIFSYFKMINRAGYRCNNWINISMNFSGRVRHWTIASEQSLLPTSCALGYWFFVSGRKIKTNCSVRRLTKRKTCLLYPRVRAQSTGLLPLFLVEELFEEATSSQLPLSNPSNKKKLTKQAKKQLFSLKSSLWQNVP